MGFLNLLSVRNKTTGGQDQHRAEAGIEGRRERRRNSGNEPERNAQTGHAYNQDPSPKRKSLQNRGFFR